MVALIPDIGTDGIEPLTAARFNIRRLGLDGLPVPRFRGRLHEMAALPFGGAGAVLAVRAHTVLETVAITVFTVSTVAMLTASAVYHCHAGSFEFKLTTRRLDHAMIFVAIGGTQTGFWLLVAPVEVAVAALTAVWIVAAAGIHHKLNHLTLSDTSGSWLYVILGWTGVALVPFLIGAGNVVAIVAVVGGGLIYSAGSLVLSHRVLDPWPKVFGYHEVWHVMVVVGVVAHGAGIASLAHTLG